MALGFARQELAQRLVDSIRSAAPQQIAQLHFLIVAEAAEHGARRRDADAVAAIAEVVSQRRDQAQSDALHLIITRGATRARERRNEVELPGKPLSNRAQRQIMFGSILLDLAQRHRF